MFPLNSNMPYIKDDGKRDRLGNVIGSGGGESYTPDYENDRLIIGVHGDYNYYIPMSKEYVGEGNDGYNIKTKSTGGNDASVYVYKIIVADGEVVYSELVATLIYNGDKTYDDENITITYASGTAWTVTLKTSMVDLETGEAVTDGTHWNYDVSVDYNWYIPE